MVGLSIFLHKFTLIIILSVHELNNLRKFRNNIMSFNGINNEYLSQFQKQITCTSKEFPLVRPKNKICCIGISILFPSKSKQIQNFCLQDPKMDSIPVIFSQAYLNVWLESLWFIILNSAWAWQLQELASDSPLHCRKQPTHFEGPDKKR